MLSFCPSLVVKWGTFATFVSLKKKHHCRTFFEIKLLDKSYAAFETVPVNTGSINNFLVNSEQFKDQNVTFGIHFLVRPNFKGYIPIKVAIKG